MIIKAYRWKQGDGRKALGERQQLPRRWCVAESPSALGVYFDTRVEAEKFLGDKPGFVIRVHSSGQEKLAKREKQPLNKPKRSTSAAEFGKQMSKINRARADFERLFGIKPTTCKNGHPRGVDPPPRGGCKTCRLDYRTAKKRERNLP
jgi:hypothetical protein